jgi:hypothetical protein
MNCIQGEDSWVLFPWTGTKIARTFDLLIKYAGYQSEFPNMLFPWVMIIKRPDQNLDWGSFLRIIRDKANEIQDEIELISNISDQLLRIHKFDQFIPEGLIRKRASSEWIDWEGVKSLMVKMT